MRQVHVPRSRFVRRLVALLAALQGPLARAEPAVLFDGPDKGFLPRGQAARLGIDPAALDALVRAAEAAGSHSLVVIKDGKVLTDRSFGYPHVAIETMSVTKSIAGLAIGMLLADGKIASLDAPLSTWFPEWATGPKAKVTLRHLLTQTSGLAHSDDATKIDKQTDRLAYARALAVDGEPGKAFAYSNEALQLLSGVVAAAGGQPIDGLLGKRLFEPLGIKDAVFSRDAAGNVQTYSGLALSAHDLARIGLVMLAEGKFEDKKLIPKDFVRQACTAESESDWYGLLWWLRQVPQVFVETDAELAALQKAGFAAAPKLKPLLDRPFEVYGAWFMEAGALLDAKERAQLADVTWRGTSPVATRPAHQIGYYADGWLGQKLAIYPDWHLVVVRQHASVAGGDSAENQRYGFADFFARVEALVPH
jgi:CubicO group peptidase (beta-lactamase class C family)